MEMNPSMVQNQLNQEKTLTENGAIAYATSGHPLMDMAFELTALRTASERQILEMFTRAFYDAPHDTSKGIFFIRDCRGGAGERRIFRVCLKWLAQNRPEIAKAVLKLIPEYGRWDDLWELLDTSLRADIVELIKRQITADCNEMASGRPVSILAKWLPSLNCSSRETKRYAEIIRSGLGVTPKKYRKTLSALRKHLNVVECKMSANEWSDIEYSHVPSKANLIYKDAFMRHDGNRRKIYLESLKNGETKINAGVLQPHEIVGKYFNGGDYWNRHIKYHIDDTLEELWKALPDVTIDDTIVVRDGSASMAENRGVGVLPIDVATALAIYMSEHNSEPWKNKFITFSSNPKMVDISEARSLYEKVEFCDAESDCSDTNIEATMMLILNTAIANHLSQEEMPKRILVISDMQFNDLVDRRFFTGDYSFKVPSKALFESIAEEFQKHGYKMPKMVFWNVAGKVNHTIPMQENEMGVILMSGFSVQLLNMAMSGKTDPYEALLETINAPRYDAVEEALKGIV